MELIKQIKEAEKQAKEIEETAKQDAADILEEAKKQRADVLAQGRQHRNKAIDEAVAQAEQQGREQAELLTQVSDKKIASLKALYAAQTQVCIEKVLSQLERLS